MRPGSAMSKRGQTCSLSLGWPATRDTAGGSSQPPRNTHSLVQYKHLYGAKILENQAPKHIKTKGFGNLKIDIQCCQQKDEYVKVTH